MVGVHALGWGKASYPEDPAELREGPPPLGGSAALSGSQISCLRLCRRHLNSRSRCAAKFYGENPISWIAWPSGSSAGAERRPSRGADLRPVHPRIPTAATSARSAAGRVWMAASVMRHRLAATRAAPACSARRPSSRRHARSAAPMALAPCSIALITRWSGSRGMTIASATPAHYDESLQRPPFRKPSPLAPSLAPRREREQFLR